VHVTPEQQESGKAVRPDIGILREAAIVAIAIRDLAAKEGGFIYIPGTSI
jgi:hypothetical protein